MRATLASEWGKTWSVRSPALTLLGGALLTLVVALSLANDFVHGITVGRAPADATMPVPDALAPALLFGTTVFVAFAMLPVTSEYATGSVRSTFLAQPRRGLVLAAKTIVVALGSTVTGALVGAAGLLGTRWVLGDHAAPLDAPALLVLKAGLLLAAYAVLVAGVACVVRSPAGTLAAGIAVTSGTLFFPERVNAWTPGGAGLRLLAGDTGQYPGAADSLVALAVLAAWAAAGYAAGAWLLNRRDA
jgi:ABC-2 type transport system permease protein